MRLGVLTTWMRTLLSFRMWHQVIWCIFNDVSDEHAISTCWVALLILPFWRRREQVRLKRQELSLTTWGHIPEDRKLYAITKFIPYEICILLRANEKIFTLLSLISKNKSKLMRSPCCQCVCESHPYQLFNAWNQSVLNLVSISWHLSPSQRRTS
jgi:hypothetical protein